LKRIISFALVLILMLIPLSDLAYATASIPEPQITIKNQDIPELQAGKVNTIKLQLENTNSAFNIVCTPQIGEGTPFLPSNITESIAISNPNQPFELKLNVLPNTTAGIYPLKLNFQYDYVTNISNGSVTIEHEEIDITVYVKISSSAVQPKILVTKLTTNPQFIAKGQSFQASIFFQNIGDAEITNISTKLSGLSKDTIFLESGSDAGFIKSIKANGNGYITYNLKAASTVASGTYELEITFKYNGIEETQKVYITISQSSTQSSNVVIKDMIFDTKQITPNDNFQVSFNLLNSGPISASNIIVKAESQDPQVVPKSTSIIKIDNLKSGESKNIRFLFSPTQDAITRNYPIKITVEYQDIYSGAEKYTFEQYVGLNAYVAAKPGEEDTPKGKPKLIIDKYNFEPTLVKAGQNFTMSLSFFNTNSTKTVKNIKIFLTADTVANPDSPSSGGSVFTPVDSSNTFYIDSIGPKGKIQKNIVMYTVPDAQAKTYTLTANFEYEDADGNEYTATELIGVPVVQESKLEIGELGYMPEAYVGQSTPISVEFFNTGKVTLYNMMVKLEGDFQTENGQYFVGNFESGSSEFFEGYVIPYQAGELSGALVFSFEDSTGQMQEIRKEFTLNVMEMAPPPEFPIEPPVEPDNGGISMWVWIGLGAVALVVIGVIVFRKRRAKKEIEDLEIDE
jgi:hypothetical protein